MAYDDVLLARVRDLSGPDLVEKPVFGARAWILDGNLAYGVHDDDLLVRLGPDVQGAAEPDGDARLRPFDPMGSGKPMKGWFLVGQDDLAEDEALEAWMGRAVDFVRRLPPS